MKKNDTQEETKINKDDPSGKDKVDSKEDPKKELTLEEKIIALEAEIYQWKNKYAMMFADMDNLRKSQDKSFSEALRYRSEGFIDKLLPALESFHIALKNPVDDPKVKNYLIGFEYIYKQIQQALEDEGVKEIPVKLNDVFDVATMHALESEVSDGKPNRVLKILSPGFRLHDRVVKQVLVIVSKLADVPNKDTSKTNLGEEKKEKDGNQAA
jgi:molecular chaperone GrpE